MKSALWTYCSTSIVCALIFDDAFPAYIYLQICKQNCHSHILKKDNFYIKRFQNVWNLFCLHMNELSVISVGFWKDTLNHAFGFITPWCHLCKKMVIWAKDTAPGFSDCNRLKIKPTVSFSISSTDLCALPMTIDVYVLLLWRGLPLQTTIIWAAAKTKQNHRSA